MMSILEDVLPIDLTSNWFYSSSGPRSVKCATSRVNVENLALHGNSASEMNKTLNTWNTIKVGSWNERELVEIEKLEIVERETTWILNCRNE